MKQSRQATLLIVSDNHIVRSGLRRIVESLTGVVVVGEATVREASASAVSIRPLAELVLLDLDSESSDPLALLRILKRDQKQAVVLVIGDLGDDGRTRKALGLGASDVVLRLQPPSVLLATIGIHVSRLVGQPPPESTPLSSDERSTRPQHPPSANLTKLEDVTLTKLEHLTERERDIVALIAGGHKNKDIAEQLHISDITVRHHLTNIFHKLGVSDRQQLLLLAHRAGLTKMAAS